MEQHRAYVSTEKGLPELTLKSILLGAILSMVLAAANAYLGLFAGMTVSASIPAAVISMGILRFFRKSNILENNAVQTAASAGEALAAGVIFTLPALLMMGYWERFHYSETTLIAAIGGILGVLFTIPLRNALIVKQKLKFPEGIATAEVLITGQEGGRGLKFLLSAAIMGGLVKFLESGANIWHWVLDMALLVKGRAFLYFGMNLSPALVSVGYIVGLRIAVLVFLGGAISWWIAIPIYVGMYGSPADISAVDLGYLVWSKKIRYLGVGAMVVGGIWAIINVRAALWSAFEQGVQALQNFKKVKQTKRVERDLPMSLVLLGIGSLCIPIFLIYLAHISHVPISAFMTIFMVIAGFLFATVAGYMAGVVGSSNNPLSGVTIATILTAALLLAAFMGTNSTRGPVAAIMIGAVVCCAAAIAGDNMQDLKSGYLLGATPRNQQIMQIIGVLSGAVIIAPVLTLLNAAYGFGPKTAVNPNALAAPQATLMQSVAEGVFGGNLPWGIIGIGAALAGVIIVSDLLLERFKVKFRMPVLAVAVGLYLPFELDSVILLGGLLAWAIQRYQTKNKKTKGAGFKKAKAVSNHAGLLFAAGLITGEALIGILLAIPVVVTKRSNVLAVLSENLGPWPGVFVLGLVCYLLYLQAIREFDRAK